MHMIERHLIGIAPIDGRGPCSRHREVLNRPARGVQIREADFEIAIQPQPRDAVATRLVRTVLVIQFDPVPDAERDGGPTVPSPIEALAESRQDMTVIDG